MCRLVCVSVCHLVHVCLSVFVCWMHPLVCVVWCVREEIVGAGCKQPVCLGSEACGVRTGRPPHKYTQQCYRTSVSHSLPLSTSLFL